MLLPGYTSMQDIISQATYQEEKRLMHFISQRITSSIKNQFKTLLSNKEESNKILDIKKDLSGFNYKAMKEEIASSIEQRHLSICKNPIARPLHIRTKHSVLCRVGHLLLNL